MRLARLIPALALCLSAAACAPEEDVSSEEWAPGKGDGAFDSVDRGPIGFGTVKTVDVGSRVSAYRIESFGNTKVRIDARGVNGSDPYLIIEGPLANDGDTVLAGAGPRFARDNNSGPGTDARLDVNLVKPGVYRVIVGTWQSLGKGQLDSAKVQLAATCRAGCTRPMKTSKEFFTELRNSGKLDIIVAGLEQKLTASLPDDPETRDLLLGQLHEILARQDFEALERFPTLPLRLLPAIRPMLGQIPSSAPTPDARLNGTLSELLGPCATGRPRPADISPQLNGISMDAFANLSLSACQAAHSNALAKVLTALAANNGSSVEYQGKTLTTPAELVDALIAAGHTVTVQNERMYANFLSFTLGDFDVKWPAWLDTGVILADGSHLTVPMGHSGHAWYISGPDVNANVMFYLGVSGAAFFGKVNTRAAWSGEVDRDVTTSGDEKDNAMIRSTLEAATLYFQRTRVERDTVAAGLPIDGYGYVGVCNDSNAIIEYYTRGTITTFPLMRAAELDQAPDLGDGLDEVIRDLPNDADVPTSDADIERRVLLMTPHDLDSPLMPDELLRKQLKLIAGQ